MTLVNYTLSAVLGAMIAVVAIEAQRDISRHLPVTEPIMAAR